MRLSRVAAWSTSLVAVFFLLLATCRVYSQTAVDGAIGGTVLDSTGAVVANAAVTVHKNHTFKFGEDFLHTDDNISNLYNQR